ncbi:MAG: CHAT domain-containing protein [Fimbriimonas sp.]
MEPTALIEAAEADLGAAVRLLRAHRGTAGLSRAYFDRILTLYGYDQGALIRTGRLARDVVRYGDDPALAQRALGIAERARGRWIASARAFVAAGDAALAPRDRFAFKTGAIDSLARAGQVDAAIALAREVKEGLLDLGEPGLAARAALNAACALMTQDRYAEAWKTLAGVAEVLERHGFSAEAASAHLEMSTSHLFGGDLETARREAETAVGMGTPYIADVARGNLAYVEILRGDADLALQRLLPLRETFADAPVDLARTLEYMGDAHMRLNLWSEAIDAYRAALAVGTPISALHRAHLRLGIGQALLASGEASAAEREMAAAVAMYGRVGNLAWRSAGEASRAEAAGNARLARRAVATARGAASPRHLAEALVVAAEITGDGALLDEAEAIVRARDIHRLRWRVHAQRAATAEGRAAIRHYRRMFDEMLAGRALTSSYASRTAYLRNKTAAVRRYLTLLLREPNARNVREAVSVIERSRAVALLDEMLGAEGPEGAALSRLQELRARLQPEAEGPATGQRRRVAPVSDLARVQRAWVEETHALVAGPTTRARAQADSAICVETEGRFSILQGGRRVPLELEAHHLDRRLRWLQYDLLAPIVQPAVAPRAAFEGLRELGETVLRPWLRKGLAGVSPDGQLWRLPWLACADALGEGHDLEIRMHPGMRGASRPWRGDFAIWWAEHPDLPNAQGEAEAILKEYPEARICRTSDEARAMLREGEIAALHVIAHARLRWDNPMLSSIEFPDGPLHAAEVARARVRIGLVSLAACDTGRLSNVNQDEPEGLVRAFLARGAGYVVGSAWTLDDAAACKMYSELYKYLRAGGTLWSSLRSAQAVVRAWNPHPYFWASPVVYGGYTG